MREREIVIRLKLPESPRKRWLLALVVALLMLAPFAYAALTTVPHVTPNSQASAANMNSILDVINSNFTAVMPVATKKQVNTINLAASGTPTGIVSGVSVTMTPPAGHGLFVASLSGVCSVSSGVISIVLADSSPSGLTLSGSLGNNGSNSGNSISIYAGEYDPCPMTWVEPVSDATPQQHTIGIDYSSTGAAVLDGDLSVVWYPQP